MVNSTQRWIQLPLLTALIKEDGIFSERLRRKRQRVAVFATFTLARLEILVVLNDAILEKRVPAKLTYLHEANFQGYLFSRVNKNP